MHIFRISVTLNDLLVYGPPIRSEAITYIKIYVLDDNDFRLLLYMKMRCYIVSFRSFPEYDIFKYDTDYMCLRVVFFQAYDKSSVLKDPQLAQ